MYHVVVGACASPSVNKTTDVSVDSVDIGRCSVDAVHKARDRLTLWRVAVNTDLPGCTQAIAVGVVTGQINQEICLVPFLQQVYQQGERFQKEFHL